ncbi:hypothetical protein F3Y22_tig00110785pilonHSYRG00146 [Hibiscus syriacus]|uniref:Uncharacterized protein n=1 Tax=Hibiscus syriacus TaxID=106335 RepID=A0A6A2ZQP8_HIBSY|nr:hypothetical protein F3Y22_tig00110785pilonHSYRG00146 [Hibiscus syriacus]
MYAETGLFFPYMHNFAAQDFQQLGDYYKTQKPDDSVNNLIPTSTISEYFLGGDGDLFKAPEPIIEESALGLDPMTAAMPLISCNEDVITSQELKAADIESFRNKQLLEVLYECEKDLMAQAVIETPLVEVLEIKVPVVKTDENQNQENDMFCNVQFSKSVSSNCLSSMERMQGAAIKSNFLDFPGMDLDSVYEMREHSKIEEKSSRDTGIRRQGGTLEGKSSMLAGRLLLIVNQGSAEGSQGLKNPTTARDNNCRMTQMKLPSEAGMK